MNTKSLFSALSALLLTAAIPAQEVSLYTDIELTSVTSATLVADVYGMPNDQAIVLAGFQLVQGMQTPFGMLYLDPASMISLGSFTLDGSGSGQLRVPLQPALLDGALFGVQAFTVGAGPTFAASKDDTVYVDVGPGFSWVSTCTQQKNGCVKVKLTGAAGTRIEVIHNDGTRAGNTQMWTGTISNPPTTLRSGLLCPPSWLPGESIIIKVDGQVIRTIYR